MFNLVEVEMHFIRIRIPRNLDEVPANVKTSLITDYSAFITKSVGEEYFMTASASKRKIRGIFTLGT